MNSNENSISDPKLQRYWYAIYTRPNFEKRVDHELKMKGLESFLPTRQVIHFWSDRKKKIEEPLFRSYVFIHANAQERYLSLQTRGVVRMVCFNGQPARIPDEQIQSIYRILEHGYDPEPYQYLNFGDEVEIVAGPLRGLRGFYIEERNQGRLVISINAIRQSIAVEVERGQVRKIRSAEEVQASKASKKYLDKLMGR
ncbi:MAG: UpxY family transcription antiterminator [Calditrichaeota bacterium]|nr:MAG: UpxY family transcription antiterminator [Calditrichota bacterium]